MPFFGIFTNCEKNLKNNLSGKLNPSGAIKIKSVKYNNYSENTLVSFVKSV